MGQFEGQMPGRQAGKQLSAGDIERAHSLAGALERAAQSNNGQEALEALKKIRQEVLAANQGNRVAAKEEMKTIRAAANREARQYEHSHNLPGVQIHGHLDAQGHKRPGIGIRLGRHEWQEWSPETNGWQPADSHR
jgi:hypothetical protein